MIRIAKTAFALAAFALASTFAVPTAQASIIVANVGDDGTVFDYEIQVTVGGPDLAFAPGDTITIEGVSDTFIVSIPEGAGTDLSDFTVTLTGGNLVITVNQEILFPNSDDLTFSITTGGGLSTATTNFSLNYQEDDLAASNSGSLLIPVLTVAPPTTSAPEPSTIVLGLMGVAGFAVVRRKRTA